MSPPCTYKHLEAVVGRDPNLTDVLSKWFPLEWTISFVSI